MDATINWLERFGAARAPSDFDLTINWDLELLSKICVRDLFAVCASLNVGFHAGPTISSCRRHRWNGTGILLENHLWFAGLHLLWFATVSSDALAWFWGVCGNFLFHVENMTEISVERDRIFVYVLRYHSIFLHTNSENLVKSRHLKFCVGNTDPSGQNWSDTLCRRRHVATCRRHFQLSRSDKPSDGRND